jgi:hypothetical protein
MWHHKTMHKKFQYGIPLILIVQIALVLLTSCRTKQTFELSAPIQGHKYEPEHSPNVFLVMYDKEIGKGPLLKAIREYKCELIYDYNIINGVALKKPNDKSLEETMLFFKKVKGVTNVEYDHIYHLIDPEKRRLEIRLDTFHMKYKDIIGKHIPWLYIDAETLKEQAAWNGYKVEIVVEGEHYDYVARITIKESKFE